jgi:hypothetical protein
MAGDTVETVSDEAAAHAAPEAEAPDRNQASRATVQSPSPVAQRYAPNFSGPSTISPKALFPLRYYKRSSAIIILYIALLITPWIATCILDVKPITAAGTSYVQPAGEYTPSDIAAVASWMRFIATTNAITAVLVVPIVGGVISHAAVVFVQRRSVRQRLDARVLLDISDAPWTRAWPKIKARTSFVTAASALIIVSILVYPLQYGFVTQEEVRVASCQNSPTTSSRSPVFRCYATNYTIGAADPLPAGLASAPATVITRRVASRLGTESANNAQIHLWADLQSSDDDDSYHTITYANNAGLLAYYLEDDYPQRPSFFVSAVPRGFSTGVLRAHAMRLNSSINCTSISSAEFPAKCPGSRPFSGSYVTSENTFRWCVPGGYDFFPWTLSRDRQDIMEEFYVSANDSFDFRGESGFTTYCKANTTRGYFELGSAYNGNTPGPLLQTYPSQAIIDADFNEE